MPIVSGNLLTTFDTLPNEWKVIFDLKPTNLTFGFDFDYWLNVFHMTNWAGNKLFGDKNPKITMTKTGLWICTPGKERTEYCIMGFEDTLAVGKWTRFEIAQEFVGTKLMVEVFINRAKVFSMENQLTGSLRNVKVYASTGAAQPAFPGHIKDLSILVKGGQCVEAEQDLSQLVQLDGSNSPATCIARCHDLGHAYAGVQNQNGCWCGGSHPTSITCNSECSEICPGDSGQKCGGSSRMNVWPTGLDPIPDDTPITGPGADATPEEIEAAFEVISTT